MYNAKCHACTLSLSVCMESSIRPMKHSKLDHLLVSRSSQLNALSEILEAESDSYQTHMQTLQPVPTAVPRLMVSRL